MLYTAFYGDLTEIEWMNDLLGLNLSLQPIYSTVRVAREDSTERPPFLSLHSFTVLEITSPYSYRFEEHIDSTVEPQFPFPVRAFHYLGL